MRLESAGESARASALQPTQTDVRRRTWEKVRSDLQKDGSRKVSVTLRQTCSWPKPRAQYAFKDSMTRIHPAIRTTYRISLRSSSLREPRYPLLRVLVILDEAASGETAPMALALCLVCVCVFSARSRPGSQTPRAPPLSRKKRRGEKRSKFAERIDHSNDPSAGSPTETLLRLLLPLGGRVYRSSRRKPAETANDRQSQRFTSTPNR